MKRIFNISILMVICTIAMYSCGVDEKETVIKVNGLTIVVAPPVTGATLTVGDTHAVTVNVKPDNATDKGVTLTSNTAAINVTPTQTGWTIKAENVGQSTLTTAAKDGSNKSTSLTFTVQAATVEVTSVTITDKNSSLKEGEKYIFVAAVKPDNATSKIVTWTSSNTAVATVNAQTGEVMAVSVGTTRITASAGGKKDECVVTVSNTPLPFNNNTVFSLIGTSISRGNPWETDLDFTFVSNTDNHIVYKAENITLLAGEFKVRMNHDWSYSWGWGEMAVEGEGFSAGSEYSNIFTQGGLFAKITFEFDWDSQIKNPKLKIVGGEWYIDETVIYDPPKSGDVYVAGNEDDVAILWKNNIALRLGNGVAKSVFVSGSDVYVAGSSNGYAVLLKNGVSQRLGNGVANSVFVSGNDVYVAGWNGSAVLWKNGVAQILGNGRANSVFVAGNDVYVVGSTTNGFTLSKAFLWKNGEIQILPIGDSAEDFAFSVCVSGNDVYVAGSGYSKGFSSNKFYCKFWKNGEISSYSGMNNFFGLAKSVYISGNNIYTAGYYNGPIGTFYYQPLFSISTNMYILSAAHVNFGRANSIYVSDNDIYIVGNGNNGCAVLWKNSVQQNLSDGQGEAYSVFVVE